MPAALSAVWAADTLDSLFLLSGQIENDAAEEQGEQARHDVICHISFLSESELRSLILWLFQHQPKQQTDKDRHCGKPRQGSAEVQSRG